MLSPPQVACACCGGSNEVALWNRLDELLKDYDASGDNEGNLIPVLQLTQGLFGYLPEAALRKIAHAFDKSFSELVGVVSFYSYFTTVPKGKHAIRVCLGTTCYVRGSKDILAALKQTLGIEVGQTSEDRLFSLDVGRCFGACSLAPVIIIDENVHQLVKPSKLGKILDQYREPKDDDSGKEKGQE